jgi:hypothetical protein
MAVYRSIYSSQRRYIFVFEWAEGNGGYEEHCVKDRADAIHFAMAFTVRVARAGTMIATILHTVSHHCKKLYCQSIVVTGPKSGPEVRKPEYTRTEKCTCIWFWQ